MIINWSSIRVSEFSRDRYRTGGVMGWQPGPGGGAGVSRDPRLAAFAPVDGKYVPVPSGVLALLADLVSGPGRDCPGATDGELTGLVKAWAAIESWAAG